MFFRRLLLFLITFLLISKTMASVRFWPWDREPKLLPPLQIDEVGGSNYVFWSVGNFLNTWTEEEWRRPGQLKPVIGLYHENPTLVREHLERMYAQGQRKIAIVIWFSVFVGELSSDPVAIHMINAASGKLPYQQEINFRNFLIDVERIGFDEIQIRFAQQWISDPSGWNSEFEYYNQNSSFIFNTIEVARNTLSKTKVIYDLGGELGGLTEGRHIFVKSYMLRLWIEYVERYGTQNTMGFSFAVAKNRVYQQYEIYQKVGFFPEFVALDIYAPRDVLVTQLKRVFAELEAFKMESTAWIIQESYYNDADTVLALREVQSEMGVHLKTLMQWPLSRQGAEQKGAHHITENFPEKFERYLDSVVYKNSN